MSCDKENCNKESCDKESCNCKKELVNYPMNTTSNFGNITWPVKQLDTENWEMISVPTEYGFYKKLLISLLADFINDLEKEEVIKFQGETRATDDWLAEMYLNDKLTYIPIIEEDRCYIKNIINSKEIIIYNYSNLSDLTLKDCLVKMLNDLKDLYNLDDCYE